MILIIVLPSNTPLKSDRFAPKAVAIFKVRAVARGGLAAGRWAGAEATSALTHSCIGLVQ